MRRRHCPPSFASLFPVEPLEGRTYFAITLATPKFFEIGGEPLNAPAVADFNGDGFDDVATAHVNASDNNISVLLNTGTGGNLGAKTDLPAGQAPTDIVAGDFNGDTKPDLATANLVDGTVSVFLNNGTGGFGAATPFAYGTTTLVGTAATAYVETADLNGDGKLDLVVSDDVDSTVVTLLGAGDGTFTKSSERSTSAIGSPGAIALADFNGDARPDVAMALGERQSVYVLTNAGDGSFGAPTEFELSGDSTSLVPNRGIAAGDFNNDSKQDVALLFFPLFGSDAAVAAVYLGNGDGTLQASVNLPLSLPTVATGLTAVDLDADGKLDLVANGSQLGFQAFRGNGDGTFVATPDVNNTTLSVNSANAAGVGDFNNDDKPDLVFITQDGRFAESQGVAVVLNGQDGGGGGGGGGGGNETVALTPTITATLPAAVVAGQKVKGTVSVAVTNTGTAALNGPVTVALFASSDTTLDDADAAVGTPVVKKLKLAPGASKTVKVKLSTLPTVPDGDYRLIARTTADGATEGTAASESAVTIAAPFVDLSGTLVTPLPATVVAGKKGTVGISLTNSGNIPATGSINVALTAGASQTPSGGDVTLPTGTVKLNLKPGASKTIKIKTTVPATLPAGAYFLLAQIDSGNVVTESDENNNLVVSTGTTTVTAP